eukprot:snap_masked-scaffold_11-processed-gene-1.22-mRNA-1 protein AED:0.06 eAED:0.06 QI:0/-1/0/1/-1/1/1/0/251
MARYDSRTTTFSPEGRLFQVEYAVKAIQNAGSCIGIKTNEAIILATEKRDISKLLATAEKSDKLYSIDSHVVCAVAGLTSDANVLVNYLRRVAQNHRSSFAEPQPLKQMLRRISDLKQGYTQFGGQRPFGVAFIYAGYDYSNGLQLCTSDPAGNFKGWNACAIGKGDNDVNSLLKEDFPDKVEDLTLDKAKKLVIKSFKKILDTSEALYKRVDVVIVKPDKVKETVQLERLGEEELKTILAAVESESEQTS